MKILIIVSVILAGTILLYGLHRFALVLEKRGYIYYREKPNGGGFAGVLNEVDKFARPSIEHTVEAMDPVREEQEHDGE